MWLANDVCNWYLASFSICKSGHWKKNKKSNLTCTSAQIATRVHTTLPCCNNPPSWPNSGKPQKALPHKSLGALLYHHSHEFRGLQKMKLGVCEGCTRNTNGRADLSHWGHQVCDKKIYGSHGKGLDNSRDNCCIMDWRMGGQYPLQFSWCNLCKMSICKLHSKTSSSRCTRINFVLKTF
jgi:hypothetical protein